MQHGCLGGYAAVYKCIICGREFEKGQSLRAHLKVHKAQMAEFSVKIPKGLRDDFRELCRAHGVTTCHVVVGLMAAAVEGFRRGVVFEWDPRTETARLKSGSNPLVVNFHQNFLGKPRSAWKTPLPPSLGAAAPNSVRFEPAYRDIPRCHTCGGPGVTFSTWWPTRQRWIRVWWCEAHRPRR